MSITRPLFHELETKKKEREREKMVRREKKIERENKVRKDRCKHIIQRKTQERKRKRTENPKKNEEISEQKP